MTYSVPLCTAAPTSPSATYQLFEIPPDLLPLFDPSCAVGPSTLTIKGQSTDTAVLTTEDTTYSLRSVSQSNSLLLCTLQRSGDGEGESRLLLQGSVSDTLEAQRCVPNLQRITSLLRATRYTGPDADDGAASARRYTVEEVHELVQASAAEIERACSEQHVFRHRGVLRQLDPAFLREALAAVVAQVEVNAYLVERVPLDEVAASLEAEFGMPADVVGHILAAFFGSRNDDGLTVRLDQERIQRFFGIEELKKARTPVPLSTFYAGWRNTCGPTLSSGLSLSLLTGEFLLHPSVQTYTAASSPVPPSFTIQRFARADLPASPAARFQDLFTSRATWSAEELDPFIADLATDGKKKDALLLKFCRASRVKVVDWSDELRIYYGGGGQTSDAVEAREGPLRRPKGKKAEVKCREAVVYSARVKF